MDPLRHGRHRRLCLLQHILKQLLLLKGVNQFHSGDDVLRLYDPPSRGIERYEVR